MTEGVRAPTKKISTKTTSSTKRAATDNAADQRGYSTNKAGYLTRLRRIEGQIRGLQRLVEEDAYCVDVLNQVSAATKALQSVAVALLDEHIRHCVRNAAIEGGVRGDELVEEALRVIGRLVKA